MQRSAPECCQQTTPYPGGGTPRWGTLRPTVHRWSAGTLTTAVCVRSTQNPLHAPLEGVYQQAAPVSFVQAHATTIFLCAPADEVVLDHIMLYLQQASCCIMHNKYSRLVGGTKFADLLAWTTQTPCGYRGSHQCCPAPSTWTSSSRTAHMRRHGQVQLPAGVGGGAAGLGPAGVPGRVPGRQPGPGARRAARGHRLPARLPAGRRQRLLCRAGALFNYFSLLSWRPRLAWDACHEAEPLLHCVHMCKRMQESACRANQTHCHAPHVVCFRLKSLLTS